MPRSAIWKNRRAPSATASTAAVSGFTSVRGAYEALGADGFYQQHGAAYSNPHGTLLAEGMRTALDQWAAHLGGGALRVLDVAAGGGEATLAFEAAMAASTLQRDVTYEACDPYTHALCATNTGRACQRWSFEDIRGGALQSQAPYDVVLASFCLHLLEDRSEAGGNALHATLRALSRVARLVIVGSPTRRPLIQASTCGWRELGDEVLVKDHYSAAASAAASGGQGSVRRRVRLRIFASASGGAEEEAT